MESISNVHGETHSLIELCRFYFGASVEQYCIIGISTSLQGCATWLHKSKFGKRHIRKLSGRTVGKS